MPIRSVVADKVKNNFLVIFCSSPASLDKYMAIRPVVEGKVRHNFYIIPDNSVPVGIFQNSREGKKDKPVQYPDFDVKKNRTRIRPDRISVLYIIDKNQKIVKIFKIL